MRAVSRPVGREKIHFETPPARRLPDEMRRFLAWFARPGDMHPLLVAGLAHFWFVTVHPFDDGNGRIARAIADMALARADRVGQRFYSMISQIRVERNAYYDLLERSQDTAYRDILDLVERGALKEDPGGGRSSSYSLAL